MGAQRRRVTAGFFETLGIPIVAGRTFEPGDRLGAPFVVVISKTLAQTFWPGEDALGRILVLPWGDGIPMEVIGIAGDVRESGPDSEYRPVFYPSLDQLTTPVLQIAIRTDADPLAMTETIRGALRELDRNVPISGFHTMDSRYGDRVAIPRFRTFLLSVFAAIALIMASMGLYGVLAYFVSQKTFEMGVRMALGASPGNVMRLVVKKGMILAGIGILLGLLGALAGTRLIRGLLFQTAAGDFLTFVLVTVCLLATAFLACLIPARHAVRVDPMVALRSE
jgi:putative ABC transport system permease protein